MIYLFEKTKIKHMKILKNKTISRSLFHGLFLMFASFLLLSACKKSESGTNSGTGTFINFTATAPNCLVTTISGTMSGTCTYDNTNRIIETTLNNDSMKVTYTYKGNTIIENENYIFPDGTKYTNTTTSYLNLAGLIEKSTQIYNSGETTVNTNYIYNGAGYLVREMITSIYKSPNDTTSYKSYSGKSFVYENENQTKEYNLNIDNQGIVTDSTLSTSTVYDLKLPGRIEAWTAWMERTGKANKNEIKSETNYDSQGSTTENYTYVIGSNGYPSSMNITGYYNRSINLQWTCK